MKLKNISFGHHLKHTTLPIFFLAMYLATLGLSLFGPFIPKTYAAVENVDQQKNRTILYALRKCISDDKIFWKDTVSGSDVNKSNISGIISSAFQSQGRNEIPVGFEIDSDNGNAKCNGISLNRALNFIDRTPDWFFGKIYDLDHPDQDGDKVIYHRRDNIFLLSNINTLLRAKDSAIGGKEKQRRLARAFWLCNEEVPDGQRPSRTNATIGGKKYQLREGKDSDNEISVGLDLEKTNGKYECGTLLKWGDKAEMAAALAAFPESAVGGGSGAGGGGGAAGEVETGCEASGILAWLACPMTTAITTAAEKLDSMINTLLTVNTRTLFCTDKSGAQCRDATDENVSSSKAYYKAWSSFRTIALGLIIIAALVVIISTAFGYEILDAYTIRKVLPRVLIAVIFITLSWSVLDFLITLTNDVGNGIRSLIYKPFLESGMEKTNVNSFLDYGLGALLTGVGLLTLTPLGLLSFVVTALLAVLIAFFVLVLRELTIIMLVLLAPIAIACLVLPNTRKVWQLWQNTLTAMLVVFPIISAMIAAGRVFSVTTYTNDGDVINQVIALIAYILPYFMIPFAFRAAGGLMATIAGLANDRSRGAFDRLKKFREGEREYKKDRNSRRIIQARSNMNNKLQRLGSSENATWAGRRAARFGSKVVGGRNIEALASAKRAAVAKEANDQIATGDDSEWRALSVDTKNAEQRVNSEGIRQYKTLGGAWVNEAQVHRARQRWGNDSFAQQASLSYEMRKAATEEQVRGIAEGYPELAKSWGMNDSQATSAWIGAAFEHQNQHLEYKNMRIGASATGAGGRSMQMSSDGYNNFVNEIYEKRGSYQMSQMGSNTIEELKNAHAAAVSSGDTDQQNKIAAIAQTFMHEGGAPTQTGTAGDGDDGTPIMAPGGPRRQANTQGAGHVAERVRELAVLTGVYTQGPTGHHDYEHTTKPDGSDLPNRREQN